MNHTERITERTQEGQPRRFWFDQEGHIRVRRL